MDQGDGKPAKDDPPGQRRQVTVLFADVADFTPLAERLGEEDSFRLMRRVSAEMMAAVQRHGGTVQDFTGDGVMALFGAPAAMEDAPMRACRAALDIQERVRGLEDVHGRGQGSGSASARSARCSTCCGSGAGVSEGDWQAIRSAFVYDGLFDDAVAENV